MITLGDISRIEKNISRYPVKVIKKLHLIAFGNEGEPRKHRKALRSFKGFDFEEHSNNFLAKIEEIKKLDEADLIAISNILNIDYHGTKQEVAHRICTFLSNIEVSEDEDLESDSDDDEESLHGDTNTVDDGHVLADKPKHLYANVIVNDSKQDFISNDERRSVQVEDDEESCYKYKERIPQDSSKSQESVRPSWKNTSFALTFRDVEDSIKSFDGKDDYPVRRWINDFEELADVTGWNELQKLIYAKKSLKGLAKLFIQSEKGIKTWDTLKALLIKEFEIKVSTAEIYKLLIARKKKKEETTSEYILIMREIGSRANLEPEAIIDCIIDGIQDDPINKMVMYGAKNFTELKEKVRVYERLKEASGFKHFQRHDFKNKKELQEQPVEPKVNKEFHRCFNCGNKGHNSKNCPNKDRGVKCFKCNNFGHKSVECPKQENEPVVFIRQLVHQKKPPVKAVKIKDVNLNALIDTGSTVNLVKEAIYYHIGSPTLRWTDISFSGFGGATVRPHGIFWADLTVDDEVFNCKFYLTPDDAMNVDVILGQELLSDAEVTFKENDVIITKPINKLDIMEINQENKHVEIKEVINDSPNETLSTDCKRGRVIYDFKSDFPEHTINEIPPKLTKSKKRKKRKTKKSDVKFKIENETVNKHLDRIVFEKIEDLPKEVFKEKEIIRTAHENWYRHVDALNSTYQRNVGMTTPFEIMIGSYRNKEDENIEELVNKESNDKYVNYREEYRLKARQQIKKVQEENKKGYKHRRKKAHKYDVNELVAIKRTQFDPGLELKPKYLGPYRVTKVKPSDSYDVKKEGLHDGPLRTSTCAEYMKPWVVYEDGESETDSLQDGRM